MARHSTSRPSARRHTSALGSRMSAIVSMTLVLVLVGMISLTAFAGRRMADELRRSLGFVVVMHTEASAGAVSDVLHLLQGAPYTASVAYAPPEAVLERWKTLMGGDDATLSLLEGNPFAPEIDVQVVPQYADADSLHAITAPLSAHPAVERVVLNTSLVRDVSAALQRIQLVLGIVAIALVVISTILIYNTVRLAIYSRRFIINTMNLVGATPAFIRRPFMRAAMVDGLLAALLAAALLAAAVWYISTIEPAVATLLDIAAYLVTAAIMLLAGTLTAALAAAAATHRYLRLQRDDLYR